MLLVTMYQKQSTLGKSPRMWFLTSNKDNFINRQEIPIDTQKLHYLVDDTQPINIWQSLMQAAPGKEIKLPKDAPNIIKEAVLDCMEMLLEQDQFVIDAIIYEQITYPKLAVRLRSIYTTCMEINTNRIC